MGKTKEIEGSANIRMEIMVKKTKGTNVLLKFMIHLQKILKRRLREKKLKDLKETLKRKAEEIKEGKKAEKEKKKKSKDKELESKGGDRKKHKKDEDANLDAREIIERRKHRNKSDEFERDGDWHCGNEVCRFINFQNNSNCKECGER